jgi:hypothetical protein
MQTVVLDIKDDKFDFFLSFLNNLKDGIIENIEIKSNQKLELDIETISVDSPEFKEIQNIKKRENQKYSIEETKKLLGL